MRQTLCDGYLVIFALAQAVILLMLTPLFTGISRQIRARMHSRRGPGIWQDYRDIHKLFKRQEVAPTSSGLMFRLMPWVLISSMLVLAMALPLFITVSPFAGGGDLITLIYLLALFRFFFALSGLDTGSPFAGVGASRELTLGILVEPMLILSLLVLALIADSTHIEMISNTLAMGWNSPLTTVLALLACGFACFIEMGKIPFDVAEAEQELQEGPLTEYSGAGLALAKWGLELKQVVMAALFVALFLPFGRAQELSLACLLTSLVVTLLKVFADFCTGFNRRKHAGTRAFFTHSPCDLAWLQPCCACMGLLVNRSVRSTDGIWKSCSDDVNAAFYRRTGRFVSPQRRAAEWGVLFAALTTLCMLSLISAFYQADKVAVTLTLVNVGDVALFGLVIDRVSTLILFVVVFLGLLVTIYSTGYLTDKNREHPHNGTNRYYAFLLVFIGAMSELHGDARYLVYGGILFAAWGKSAQLPMQAWLPDAMEAPTPISAYLHAASMVKVGVYIFARAIIDGGNIPHVIGGVGMVMALVTILYGFLMYLPQQDMKRLLAWSTITQLGWMFFGLSLSIFGSRLALEGSIAYIVNHAFAKSLFFLVAGAQSYSCGTRLLPRLRGVLHTLPLPGVGFCVAALAITGVPPFNGFFSKFPLFAAGFALSVEYWILLPAMILLMIESVASFAWFIRWFGRVVPGKPSEAVADAAPLPGSMRLVLIVLIVMSLISSVIAATWLQ
ncbi:hydrogenase-4 component D [Escherichia coli]|uniref:Hydrogenase-4 component D n=21 Tax=Pseudomonadota TaxID=1224 RepID=A0A377BUL3_ECOLX|nr:hydrogenase-4 component D [Escherichia coli]